MAAPPNADYFGVGYNDIKSHGVVGAVLTIFTALPRSYYRASGGGSY